MQESPPSRPRWLYHDAALFLVNYGAPDEETACLRAMVELDHALRND